MFKTSQIIRSLINQSGVLNIQQSIIRNRHSLIGSAALVNNVIVLNSRNYHFNCSNRLNHLNRLFYSTMTSQLTTAFVGRKAPEFSGMLVENGQFREIRSENYFKQNRFVVLLFYPMDFTFVCPTEILAFDDRLAEFNRLNCDVIGVSCDSHFCHLAWTKTERRQGGLAGLKMPLLADKNAAIAKSYGVYLDDKGIALRGLFIIDGKGVLRQIIVNDLPVGRSVDEALRLVEAIQFTDKHGEVCPAGWKPGKKTMVPDPVKSLDYFNAAN